MFDEVTPFIKSILTALKYCRRWLIAGSSGESVFAKPKAVPLMMVIDIWGPSKNASKANSELLGLKLSDMLIVSSLDRAREAFEKYKPSYIISILSEDEPRPTFRGLNENDHLKLYVDCEDGPAAHNATARARTELIIKGFQAWEAEGDPDAKVLVHCAKGVSRSTAAAFIIMCLSNPDVPEAKIARYLRKVAPHADPCLFMINHADDILGREGRMFDAIDDLSPCRTTIDAPIVVLQAAA